MDFEKYKNTKEYPAAAKRICKKCNTLFKHEDQYCSQCGHHISADYEIDVADCYIKRREYGEETRRLTEQFKHDALEDVGLLNHPKADKIYFYAWQKGHSSGFSEVYYELCDLVDLFLD